MISEWFISQVAMIYFPGSNDLFPKQQWFISKIAMIYFPGSNELFQR